MATQSDIITKACNGALEEIQKKAPAEYAKLNADPDKKAKLIQAANSAATECVKLAEEFADKPHENIAERLAKHLSGERIKLIQGGLSIPTFRMDITKSAGNSLAQFTRGGEQFLTARALATSVDIDWATIKQYGSVLVEAVLLVMSAAGISVSPSSKVIGRAVEEAVDAIQASSKLQKALEVFVEAWNEGGSAFSKAKALFNLIKDSYAAGILWTIIKTVCSEMAWYEWLEAAAKVTAMIIAALATDGVALIAEIALIVLAAVDFARKIANIVVLSELKQSL
ncbi:uncharacterized protein LOC119732824 [Patiria miniata]|uniref:Uncharacterized protein n=1 Tax=Patiria miniata TaxID=46514 RepID=A0A914AG51_PATMI|nr:uncharacterized protein LOC119732824 [Patiria miniata]